MPFWRNVIEDTTIGDIDQATATCEMACSHEGAQAIVLCSQSIRFRTSTEQGHIIYATLEHDIGPNMERKTKWHFFASTVDSDKRDYMTKQ